MAKENHTAVYFDRENERFIGLDDARIQQLKDAYPGVNIVVELNKMILWLTSPKGIKRKGELSFIMNWLNNVTPSQSLLPDIEQNNPLRPYLNTYLKDLWIGKEHLLEINKRTS